MRICTIVGARPQFIKAAAVSRSFSKEQGIDGYIVHTGQHYDTNMSETFFNELDIPRPAYNLHIGSATHGQQTAKMLAGIEDILLHDKPDWVLVYGDTNSTLAGALAAVKLNIPIAHVEAGLRSFNRRMPEEINRVMTDHISSALFTPGEASYQQLVKEGISKDALFNVGDVMYDALLYYKAHKMPQHDLLDKFNLKAKSYGLVTVHRAENTDNKLRLEHICEALIELSQVLQLVIPLHPRTRNILDKLNYLHQLKKHALCVEPLGYLDILALQIGANYIITDSGGMQKEAYFNQIPCITLRDETEWPELLETGWNQLCSPENSFSLVTMIKQQLEKPTVEQELLYGDGTAADKITNILLGR